MRFQEVKQPIHQTDTTLPKRATKGSAGYDFHLKEPLTIRPGESILTLTDVKCQLEPNEVLYLHVRSSIGIKKHLMMGNGTGVIDSDYYGNPDNDGNIGVCLHNYGTGTIILEAGERVAQGVIHPFNATETVEGTRTGGIGSSGV